MSLIRIKRSGTAASPSALAQGELAYSYLAGTQGNGGDRLYIGTGTETGGVAANIEVIGGKYFTDKLDHTPGILTANSALIVDGSSKIDVLNVDNITIDGNTISSTNSNGDVILSANGTGSINVSSSKITNLATPTLSTDAATKGYVDSNFLGFGSNTFVIAADSGSADPIAVGETVTFAGGTGLSSTVANNTITIDLDNTGVVANTYGSSTAVPVITVDAQGRITSANTASISTDLSIAADSGTDQVSLLSETLTIAGGTGLTSSVANNTVTIDLDNTTVAAGSYGSATAVASFTVDAQGRLTAASNTTIAITSSAVTDFTEAAQDAIATAFTAGTQSGLSITYDDNAGSFSFNVNDPTITLSGDVTGSATMTNLGNITINTTIEANSVALGTDTTGDYVATVTGGTGVTVTGSGGETAAVTVAIGQDVSTTANVTFNNITVNGTLNSDDITASTVTISGNLVVTGTTTTVNTETIELADNLIVLNSNLDPGTAPSQDSGIEINRGSSANVSFVWDETNDTWSTNGQSLTASGGFIGNASTASKWLTARTITLGGDLSGSVSIDGTANVTLTATIAENSVALGTDTTGNYAADVSVTAGTGLAITGSAGEGTSYVLSGVDATTSVKGVASFTSDNFTVSSGAVSIAAIDGGTY